MNTRRHQPLPVPPRGRHTLIAVGCSTALMGCAAAPPLAPDGPVPVQVQTEPPAPAPAATVAAPLPVVAAPAAAGGGQFDVAALRQAPPMQQKRTAPMHNADLHIKLKRRWTAKIGKTTFRTTMAMVGNTLVIGTHGASLGGKNEPSDAVYLLEAASGAITSRIQPPGRGDRDVGGVAVGNAKLYFSTDNGFVVAADFAGHTLWRAHLRGKVRAAPALGDLNRDGVLDVVVGDEQGQLAALNGRDGRPLWLHQTGANAYGSKGFIGGAAIGDLDGDGKLEVIAGARDGVLAAYDGSSGAVRWQVQHASGIHASPQIADFDGDGQLEVLAAWSYGDLLVLDGRSGQELWGTRLALDEGGIEGLFGTPVPLPGAPGVIVQGTSWWGENDGVVLVGATQRAHKGFEGRVSASAIVSDLNSDGQLEAIIGTERGLVLAVNSQGARQVLVTLKGPIEAPAMLADTDGDGSYELLVAAGDGLLHCFETGSRAKPWLARFHGNDPSNRGSLGRVRLGWTAGATTRIPLTHPGSSSGGSVRIDYLICCSALQQAATRAPIPTNRALLKAAASCNAAAANGEGRVQMLRAVRKLAASGLPAVCR